MYFFDGLQLRFEPSQLFAKLDNRFTVRVDSVPCSMFKVLSAVALRFVQNVRQLSLPESQQGPCSALKWCLTRCRARDADARGLFPPLPVSLIYAMWLLRKVVGTLIMATIIFWAAEGAFKR